MVGGTCLLALAGLELVQRLVPASSRQPHNDVAGFIYAALTEHLNEEVEDACSRDLSRQPT